jgi:hypothetical protein
MFHLIQKKNNSKALQAGEQQLSKINFLFYSIFNEKTFKIGKQ